MGRSIGSRMGKVRKMGRGRGMGIGKGMGSRIRRVKDHSKENYTDRSDLQQPTGESMYRDQELTVLNEQAKTLETYIRDINTRTITLEEDKKVTDLTADIDKNLCAGCLRCASVCPTDAISLVDDIARIDQLRCTVCGQCIPVCPQGAIVIKQINV